MVLDLGLPETIELFRYDNGSVFWRVRKQGRNIFRPITTQNSRGYVHVSLHNRAWPIHRIVWRLHYGEIPSGLEVDHINRVKFDNRIENLRLVTRSQNLHNVPPKRGNKGGCVGVNWVKARSYWQATICVNYDHVYLGSNADYFEACCLRKSAEITAYKKMGL